MQEKSIIRAKKIANFVVTTSVAAVVKSVIKSNTEDTEKSRRENAQLWIGSHVIGKMVADAASGTIDAKVETLCALVTHAQNLADENQPEQTPES